MIAEEENDSAEEDYVPPRNYEEDSTDFSDDEDSDGESKCNDDIERIRDNAPERSKLNRKRKIKTTEGINQRKKTKVSSNKKMKTALDRVNEFPNNCLTSVNLKLACRACNVPDIALKKSTIKNHINGESHRKNLAKKDRSQVTMLHYRQIVVTNEREESSAGSTLPLDVNAYRMAVAHALLKTGTPFAILDVGSEIRDLFEDCHSTCPKQACSDFIPLLNKNELSKTIEELNEAKAFSICTDGTINVAEAFGMVSFRIILLIS